MLIEGVVLRSGRTKKGKFVTTIFDNGTVCLVMTDEPVTVGIGEEVSIPVRAARSKDGSDPFFFGL